MTVEYTCSLDFCVTVTPSPLRRKDEYVRLILSLDSGMSGSVLMVHN